ncbi:M48 family metalloprotease [Rhodoplanes sp. TEM]|uniref:M48 family metalloprotease n=1 Tax=Rhodoplanes tepidamans TaxID=200616 RepID=A0ABT5JJZ0_RHOTP|nr:MULTISPECIES: M48 family metalloprotease [Rhodoplanes]MDC7789681.1 M48 family metalloprotease [Rhodoplanes tepidamans]MDC7987914.1 M48 family metalloprotease [Rhodoplanes sp. TEM]MDQ0359203.1 putative Zn-dependent protease [Rhodoplanes tepidamans]
MSAASDPVKRRLTLRASRAVAVAVACAVTVTSLPTPAHAQRMPLIRDAEIEQLLRDYTRPILKAAGLAQQNVKVIIINDRGFNAFVMDGRRIFVNAGALMDSQTPNQIIGVLAHETGHIAGGHLAKLRTELANASTMAIIAVLLGLGAAVAGSRSGQVGGNPAAVAMAAPTSMIQRSLLAYQRQHEEQADRAGVKFLTSTGQSARGMVETFKRFADQQLFASQGADPYLMSHPMPRERIAALQEIGKTQFWDKKDSPELQLRHDMMRAKLHGFLDQPGIVARHYPLSDQSLPARYARAISTYRHGDLRQAIAQIDGLIQAQPNNPYFYELKGQMLLEAGRPAEALAPLRRAVGLAPSPLLIQVMLSQALIATNDPKAADEAIGHLQKALLTDPDIADGYAQLAKAYGRKGDIAQADLAAAQAALARGDSRTARQLALRAKERMPVGSPGWVKADDIASVRPTGTSGGRRP